jgi:ELWxxDGT repeat protein/VCBS repeat-containing protein
MSIAIFTAAKSGSTLQLWETDGTAAGTFQTTDIADMLLPQNFVDLNGTLYFLGSDATMAPPMVGVPTDWQLWRTDGTAAGTVKITNGDFSPVSGLTDINGTLLFFARDPVNGEQLWKSDGTASGTVMVTEINPSGGGISPIHQLEINGSLYFAAGDGGASYELWKSDGTAVGTVKLTNINGASGGVEQLFNLNDTVFFKVAGADGDQIWKTDGTAAGTLEVLSTTYISDELVVGNNTLFYSAQTSFGTDALAQLWKSDGTAAGTILLGQYSGSSLGNFEQGAASVGHSLFFTVFDNAGGGEHLWKTDGTSIGTSLVKDIGNGSSAYNLTEFQNELYFFETDSVNNSQLWKSDGTAIGTVMIKEVNSTDSFARLAGPPVVINGALDFEISDSNPFVSVSDTKFWTSDGTSAGTIMYSDVADLSVLGPLVALPGSSSPPVIDLSHSVLSGVVSELPLTTRSSTLDHSAGVVAFTDKNLLDRPTATVTGQTLVYHDAFGNVDPLTAAQISALEGAFSIAAEVGNTNNGKVDWTFSVADQQFDFLGVGESLILTSTIQVDDHHGGIVNQDVTVAINGADDVPRPIADSAVVQKGMTVTTSAADGVLANDSDPDIHDVLHVTAVSFGNSTAKVTAYIPGFLHGTYGTLTLDIDGGYSYVANKNLGSAASTGAVDQFSYTVSDGHGGTASSTLSITVDLHAPAAAGSLAILADAKTYIGTAWGNENCTGFVFTVSNDIGAPFFYGAGAPVQETGAFGNDPAHVHFLNDTHSSNSFFFAEPISDIQAISSNGLPTGGVRLPTGYVAQTIKGSVLTPIPSSSAFVVERADTTGDNWHLVGGTNGGNFSTINPNDPSTWPTPGDVFRGVVVENSTMNGSHELITHAGIVSSYDPVHDTLTLIDNYAHSVNGQDTIGYTTFNVHAAPGHFPALLAGYYDVYHLV